MYAIDIKSENGPRGMKRAYKSARVAALNAIVDHWIKNSLPIHFTQAAMGRYGYAPRTAKYVRRKRRLRGTSDPNVYTGNLRSQMHNKIPSRKIDENGITFVWRGLPRYTFYRDTYEFKKNEWRWNDEIVNQLDPIEKAKVMRWRQSHPDVGGGAYKKIARPDKVAEITKVTDEEQTQLAKRYQREFTKQLNAKGQADG